MPKMSQGLFTNGATSYSWTAGVHNVAEDNTALDSQHMIFPNPPYEVGLWSLVVKTTDTGGGTPTLDFDLYFSVDPKGTYYDDTKIDLSDIHANATITSGATFICRLDSLSKWLFGNGFKIRINRNTNNALTIDHAEIIAI